MCHDAACVFVYYGAMDNEPKARGIMSKLTDVIRSILSDGVADTTERVERAIAMDNWRSQIWRGVFEHDSPPEFDFWPHDIFFDDGGEVFAVAVSNGSLFRFPVDTSDPENVSVGEPTEVVVDFIPVERKNFIKRREDGRYHGLAILCSSALNKDSEIDSRALFDTFVERFAGDGSEYVNVYHLGGNATAVGHFDYLGRDENLLIAHYVLDDTPVARAIGETLTERGEGWGWSIEYDPDDTGRMTEVMPGMSVRVFDNGSFLGSSILRVQHACAWWTGQSTTRIENDMTDRERAAIAELLQGDDALLESFEGMADTANARAATAVTRNTVAADDETPADDRLAALENAISALTARFDSFGETTVETVIESQDIELDEAAQDAIAQRVIKDTNVVADREALVELQHRVGIITGEFEAKVQLLTERIESFESDATSRLADVERTDAEKIADHDDLKPSQSPLIRVGVRPTQANAGEQAPINMATAMEERMGRMNTGKKNVA